MLPGRLPPGCRLCLYFRAPQRANSSSFSGCILLPEIRPAMKGTHVGCFARVFFKVRPNVFYISVSGTSITLVRMIPTDFGKHSASFSRDRPTLINFQQILSDFLRFRPTLSKFQQISSKALQLSYNFVEFRPTLINFQPISNCTYQLSFNFVRFGTISINTHQVSANFDQTSSTFTQLRPATIYMSFNFKRESLNQFKHR